MSGINTDLNSVAGSGLTPAEQAAAGTVGTPVRQTPVDDYSAALVDINDGASASHSTVNVPADVESAAELAASLAGQIRQQGPSASAAHAELSGESTFKLTQP